MSVLIHHHLGLGDAFVCNGLVRYVYFNFYPDLTLVVKKNNLETLKNLYADIDIKFLTVNSDYDVNPSHYSEYIKIGFDNCIYPFWEKSFYDQLKIPYVVRHLFSSFPRNRKKEIDFFNKIIKNENYALCNNSCSSSSFNLNIQTPYDKIYLEKLTDNFLDWLFVIENAKEIHTVDSAFFHVVKNLNLKCPKIFYNRRQDPFCFDHQSWNLAQ